MKDTINRLKYFQKKSGFSETNYLRDKNWMSSEYWRYRIYRPIIKLRFKSFRKKNNPSPWISPPATLFFDEWLDKDKVGAEFGSGISTIFFAARTKAMVCIEHYEPWYKKVTDLFKEKGITNIDYRFIEVDKNNKNKALTPQLENYLKQECAANIMWDFQNYFESLADFEDEHFDFILVDGRARPECVLYSIDKLKSGGLMVLDNSERKRYSIVFEILGAWDNYTTSNGLTDTTFWIKP
ncbi:O-methyltransferase [Brumimicrobium mesophilum]|uniref:class I SAM-dependent methyltransferase n=1 Tax=Brumimicrobium mesophilum TaxID=392717 RepID=UPI000D141969|nr:class I SAM-dependent methyltransferase [Brumimicrobium mesophilum]